MKLLYKLLPSMRTPLRYGPSGPFVFVHINKTAGTSIGKAVGMPVKMHLTVTDIISRIGSDAWQSAFTFTFVRNPWDKVVSHYEYRRKKNKTGIASKGVEFTDWVRMTYGDDQNPEFYNNRLPFQPQVDWLKDSTGRVDIDFVGRFETINEDFNRLKDALGLDTGLPHLNASKHAAYSSYYNDQTRRIVGDWFREDIELFGYTF